jgi:hypothetical protein
MPKSIRTVCLEFFGDDRIPVEHAGVLLQPGFSDVGVVDESITLGFKKLDLGSCSAGAEAGSEDLATAVKMMQVGPAVGATCIAAAVRIHRAGVVPVPLNTRGGADSHDHILADSGLTTLSSLTEGEWVGFLARRNLLTRGGGFDIKGRPR